jgi:hypothetical protein
LITITRLLARNVSTLFRRGLMLSPREARFLPVTVIVGHGVRLFRAATSEFAVQYQEPTDQTAATVTVPWEALHKVSGNKPDPVTLACEDKDIVAQWNDKDIPQVERSPVPDAKTVKPFPAEPTAWAENSPELLAALHHAFETTDAQPCRYALASIQFRGASGSLAAADGRQLLVQHGFTFGFDEDLLARPTSVFGASQLADNTPVRLGRSEKHLAVRTGPWTFWMPIDTEGRFPRVDDIVPRVANTHTSVDLHPGDANFLAENLSRLPTAEGDCGAVTLDLNGDVLVRSRGEGSTQPTELKLINSNKSGDDIRLVTDRKYLSRALAMGLSRLHISDPNSPILAQDDRRSYLWALLDKDGVIKPSPDAIVVESPFASTRTNSGNTSRVRSTPTPMPKSKSVSRPVATEPHEPVASSPVRDNTPPNSSPIEQAIHLRGVLRDPCGSRADYPGHTCGPQGAGKAR